MELHQSLNYIAVLLAEESALHYVKQLGIRIDRLCFEEIEQARAELSDARL